MSRRNGTFRAFRYRVLKRSFRYLLLKLRVLKFRLISDHRLAGARVVTPTLAIGRGQISAIGVQLGFWPSPYAFSGVIHLEARNREGSISIGSGTILNNGAVIISDGPGVEIGERVFVGPGVQIYDSDFHSVNSAERHSGVRSGKVTIGDDVFIGAGVIVLRGTNIGEGATIGAGAVVRGVVSPASVFIG